MNRQLLETIKEEAEKSLASVNDPKELENWRVKYLGRKSELMSAFRNLGQLSPEERAKTGNQANEIKNALSDLFNQKEKELINYPVNEKKYFDFTLPGYPYRAGHTHPLTQTLNEIVTIFISLGFITVEGPEIETDYYNFEALNFPKEHPARDMQDSFYLQTPMPHRQVAGEATITPLKARLAIGGNHQSPNEYLLRTHTSPVQIRVMEKNKPPLRVIVPGRVFRHEAIDASHSAVFHQVEGFAVDKKITFADLKGTLNCFVRKIFGENAKARFRPSYFPFVEPGAEVDVSCIFCSGKGCRVCKNSGYLELLGAGMIHPNVFKAAGYQPREYTGFAFGIGVERIAMLKYGIDDMRLFYANDLRFLSQF